MTMPRKNWLEWTVFGVGLTLLLAVVGFLLVETFVVAGHPAALSVELAAPRAPEGVEPAHVVVPVTVRNAGARAAEAVVVEVERVRGDAVERGQVEFTDVPRLSSRTGLVTFPPGRADDELRARIVSYTEP